MQLKQLVSWTDLSSFLFLIFDRGVNGFSNNLKYILNIFETLRLIHFKHTFLQISCEWIPNFWMIISERVYPVCYWLSVLFSCWLIKDSKLVWDIPVMHVTRFISIAHTLCSLFSFLQHNQWLFSAILPITPVSYHDFTFLLIYYDSYSFPRI